MNNKGFTLVELLAVIVILTVVMLIGTVSINGIKQKINKNMFENKLTEIINAAQLWGQDNKEYLSTDVTKTVNDLINGNYLETDEKDDEGKLVVTNNYEGGIVNSLRLKVYLEYSRVYSCIIKDSENQGILREDANYSKYGHLNYYCS